MQVMYNKTVSVDWFHDSVVLNVFSYFLHTKILYDRKISIMTERYASRCNAWGGGEMWWHEFRDVLKMLSAKCAGSNLVMKHKPEGH